MGEMGSPCVNRVTIRSTLPAIVAVIRYVESIVVPAIMGTIIASRATMNCIVPARIVAGLLIERKPIVMMMESTIVRVASSAEMNTGNQKGLFLEYRVSKRIAIFVSASNWKPHLVRTILT